MKSSLFGFVLVSTLLSFAQAQDTSLSTSVESQPKTYSQKGFTVGPEYINFTDVSIDEKATSPYSGTRTTKESHMGSTHMGAAGIRLGYTQTPEKGLGFNAGLTYLDAFNESERGNEKIHFVIPHLNLTAGMGRFLTAYAGGNICVLSGNEFVDKYYKPSLGLQAGLGVRFTKNIAMNAGYSMISQAIDYDESGYKETGAVIIGGFNSSLTYTF